MEGKIGLLRTYFYVVVSIPVYAVLYISTALSVLLCILFSLLKLERIRNACIRFWARSGFFIMGATFTVHGYENFDKQPEN